MRVQMLGSVAMQRALELEVASGSEAGAHHGAPPPFPTGRLWIGSRREAISSLQRAGVHARAHHGAPPFPTGEAISSLQRAGVHVFFAVGSAGVADNAVMECDSHGLKCGLQLGYTHNNNGRCYQLRLNTSAEVSGKGWQWPPSGPESIDIIMQSINTGLNNAFDLYMAQSDEPDGP